MSSLRLSGVVAAMNHVRAGLAAGVPVAEQPALRAYVTDTVAEIERACRARHTAPSRLPRPTYAAYRYLKELDLTRIREPAAGTLPTPPVTRVSGLTAFAADTRERLGSLAEASVAGQPADLSDLLDRIAGYLTRLDAAVDAAGHDLGRLPDPSRRAHQWLAWLVEPGHAAQHLAALAQLVQRGHYSTGHPERPPSTRKLPVTAVLYHTASLFRGRTSPSGIQITASQVLVGAPDVVLEALVLAGAGAGGSYTKRLRDYAASEDAAEVALALELAGVPVPAVTRGRHHDLAAIFEQVNGRCFEGRLSAPKLTWSRAHTARKLGHYQQLTDTVMLSTTLDDPRVPDYVVNFVMYHELLHRILGAKVSNGRHLAHGAAFRRAERAFPEYAQAQAYLGIE
jgi:hypothetical protein